MQGYKVDAIKAWYDGTDMWGLECRRDLYIVGRNGKYEGSIFDILIGLDACFQPRIIFPAYAFPAIVPASHFQPHIAFPASNKAIKEGCTYMEVIQVWGFG